MYIKLVCLFYFLFLVTQNTSSQNRGDLIIKGVLQNHENYQLIEGAYVSVNNKLANAISNIEGEFLLILDNSNYTDSLIIEALGYKKKVVPISDFIQKITILLTPIENILPEVIVRTYNVNWASFVAKYVRNIKPAKIPFESELQKSIIVVKNGDSTKKIMLRAYSHYEGLTAKGFSSYLRGLNCWFVVDNYTLGDTTKFIAYSESGKPQVFTELELGKFQWLMLTDTTGISKAESIAKYDIESISLFGEDSVYIVKHTPKSQKENNRVRLLNDASSNNLYSFFSTEKRFYIRKKDFKLIRIDFYQYGGMPSGGIEKNIKYLNYISGSVGFYYIDETIHPTFIKQKISYIDIDGNSVERIDNTYFSNIKSILLSDAELNRKYQINKIYRSYPIRDVSLKNYKNIGAFWYVPIIKN